MGQGPAKVIEVDFQARRRVDARGRTERSTWSAAAAARQVLNRAAGFLLFWRPPARRSGGEYLGGRWEWGWTLFVWTSDAAVGPVWSDLVEGRGYVPQRLTPDAFQSFLRRAQDVGGLLLDGELDGGGRVIRAETEQLIRREDALVALGR